VKAEDNAAPERTVKEKELENKEDSK